MAPCKYALKAGVLLQAFGNASKTCTNVNLTDELAEWHLQNHPGCEIYFSVMPGKAAIPDEIRNRPTMAGPTIIVPPEKEIPKIVGDFIKAISDPPVEVIPRKTEIEEIKEKLTALGIKYHPKTGLDKLKILLAKSNP